MLVFLRRWSRQNRRKSALPPLNIFLTCAVSRRRLYIPTCARGPKKRPSAAEKFRTAQGYTGWSVLEKIRANHNRNFSCNSSTESLTSISTQVPMLFGNFQEFRKKKVSKSVRICGCYYSFRGRIQNIKLRRKNQSILKMASNHTRHIFSWQKLYS